MRSSGLRKLKLFEMRIKTWNFRTTIYGVRSIAFLTSLSAHCALVPNHWSDNWMVTLSPDLEGKQERQSCPSKQQFQVWARPRRWLWQDCRTRGGWTSPRSVQGQVLRKVLGKGRKRETKAFGRTVVFGVDELLRDLTRNKIKRKRRQERKGLRG